MPLRTATLATAVVDEDGVDHTVATVPDGQTWIVKEWAVYNGSSGPVRITLSAFSDSGSGAIRVFRDFVELAGDRHDEGEVWTVLSPGDRLVVNGEDTPTHPGAFVWFSGARLAGVVE